MTHPFGQHLIVGIQGLTLSHEEKKFLVEEDGGGVVLFRRNCQDIQQLSQLCEEIQSLSSNTASKLPFFIGIDMEGGRVHRLPSPPFTHWPALQKLGELDSPQMAFQFAFSMARELKALGINLNFAPCLDTLSEPRNEVIGDRALSQSSRQVTQLGSAILRGYLKAELLSCAKHFPGHGNTLLDSHKALPKETQTWEELQKRDVQPFEKAFRSQLKMVMTAHILFENIDPKWPASLSPTLVQEYLRGKFYYEELVISDDLDMKALTLSFAQEEIPAQVLQGGSDLLLYCNEPESPVLALESLKKAYQEKKLEESLLKVSMNRIVRIKREQVLSWQKKRPPLTCIACEQHIQLQEAILAKKILKIPFTPFPSSTSSPH